MSLKKFSNVIKTLDLAVNKVDLCIVSEGRCRWLLLGSLGAMGGLGDSGVLFWLDRTPIGVGERKARLKYFHLYYLEGCTLKLLFSTFYF